MEKAAVKELIMERFDIFAEQADPDDLLPPPSVTPAVNGHAPGNGTSTSAVTSTSPGPSASPQKRSVDPDTVSHSIQKSPPQKKRKSDLIDADAAFAAKLQAEENLRARPTRGANQRKAAPVKKKKAAKPKAAKKVKAEDDSDLEGSGSEPKKEVTRTGGFHVWLPYAGLYWNSG